MVFNPKQFIIGMCLAIIAVTFFVVPQFANASQQWQQPTPTPTISCNSDHGRGGGHFGGCQPTATPTPTKPSCTPTPTIKICNSDHPCTSPTPTVTETPTPTVTPNATPTPTSPPSSPPNNGGGGGGSSNGPSGPPGSAVCNVPFQAPILQGFTADGNGSVTFSWWPSPNVSKYSITYGYNTDNMMYGEDNIPGSSTSITLNGLTPGQNVWAQVQAWQGACEESSNLFDPVVR